MWICECSIVPSAHTVRTIEAYENWPTSRCWKRSNRAQHTGSIQNALLLLRHMLCQLDNIARAYISKSWIHVYACVVVIVHNVQDTKYTMIFIQKKTTHPTHIWFCGYKKLGGAAALGVLLNVDIKHVSFYYTITFAKWRCCRCWIGMDDDSPRMSITIHVLIQSPLHRAPNQLPKSKLTARIAKIQIKFIKAASFI